MSVTTTQQPAIDGDDDDGDEIWVAWRIQRQPESSSTWGLSRIVCMFCCVVLRGWQKQWRWCDSYYVCGDNNKAKQLE